MHAHQVKLLCCNAFETTKTTAAGTGGCTSGKYGVGLKAAVLYSQLHTSDASLKITTTSNSDGILHVQLRIDPDSEETAVVKKVTHFVVNEDHQHFSGTEMRLSIPCPGSTADIENAADVLALYFQSLRYTAPPFVGVQFSFDVGEGSDTRRQVEVLAHQAATVQRRTAEQLGQVQQQQDRLAAQTSEYLQAQHDRQSCLLEQQVEMRRQMEEHRQYLEEQYRLLKAAEEAVGLQGQRLENLAEAVKPHLQARWGAFAEGAAPSMDNRPLESPAVTVAAGTNLPVPPIYRGSSKKEKREFMDSYAIYTRRIQALNQGTQAKFFVMPLSACIEQGTMTFMKLSIA
uniref:Uncharacterized protein n=1 Tax=Phytophthora ramorum TaxID=164328 RepID=H3GI18_PHYRM